jgi:anthranilate synthase component II
MKILVLDNYDSFTYNLVQLIERITGELPDVYRNDKISLEAVGQYEKILLSPGPGLPEESGILPDVIKTYAASKSIFGVCLGLQAMAVSFGGKLTNLGKVYHGISTPVMITDKEDPNFEGLPDIIEAGRYHSWVADATCLPDCFRVTALDANELIMAIRHQVYDLSAVQFHPESILTPLGEIILRNWINQPHPKKSTKNQYLPA